jgi:hypothetical protein
MEKGSNRPMKRPRTTTCGQFTLAIHQESSPHLDPARREELLKVLADLMLEALGVESGENPVRKEGDDESQNHA